MPEVRSLLLGVLLVLLLVFAPPAAASVLVHPDLDSATERLFSSRGPEAYTTLRKVWDTWDRADPERVEQVLRLAADSAKLSPQVRAYARLLSAYARSRRGDLATARRIISELGYVDQWLAVGPFDNEGKAGFDEPFEPERDLSEPLVPGRAFTGKERPVRWRRVPAAFPS